MSLAIAFCTPHGIVMGADRCITITLEDKRSFCHTMTDQKLFLAPNGYGFSYTHNSTFRGLPASYWMERFVPRFAELNLSVAEFTRKLCIAFNTLDPQKNTIIIGTGYENGKPQVYSGSSMYKTLNSHVESDNTCIAFSGEDGLAKHIIDVDALPIERSKYTVPDAVAFVKHVILTVSNMQKFANTPVTVGPDCDILVVTKDASGWIEPPVFNLSS